MISKLKKIMVFGTRIFLSVGEGTFAVSMSGYDRDYEANFISRYEGTTSSGRDYSYSVNYSPEPGAISHVTATTYQFNGFLSPLSTEMTKVFKLNRTIPMKFSVSRQDGDSHDDIIAKLTLQHVDANIPIDEPIDPISSGEANTDGYFRYDSESDQYIYNLSTKDLSIGTWELIVRLDDGSEERVRIGLK